MMNLWGNSTTIELSEVIRNTLYENGLARSVDFQTTLENVRPFIFNFNYDLKEEYKKDFETMFLARNYFKDLSQETYTRWHYKLQARLIQNVSKYNILFDLKTKDTLDAINTFKTLTTSSSTGDVTGSSSSQQNTGGENTSYQKTRSMDTPQGRLEIENDYVSALGNSENVSESTGTASESSNTAQTQESTSTSESSGFSGGLNSLMLQHAVVIQEVVSMILSDFDDLFSSVLI